LAKTKLCAQLRVLSLEERPLSPKKAMLAKQSAKSTTKVIAPLVLAALTFLTSFPLLAQGLLRQRLQRNLGQTAAEGNLPSHDASGFEKYEIAGLKVAVWKPKRASGPCPLVVFSHGFHGSNVQSKSIMQALAQAGYLVVAPNHQDAMGNGGSFFAKPEISFKDASSWTDSTFKKRGDDVVSLIDALHKDPQWKSQIDWSKVALAGHSLGGYTVLALAGAWPSWKLPNIKAVLALSPYCQPFVENGNLSGLTVPVMYQGGTRDFGITPTVRRPGGAFSKTSSPAYFVEFDKVGHFSFCDLNRDKQADELINHYAVAFLNKYVKGDPEADPGAKLKGVAELDVK
jgi:predicted dienelactone hydrolase